MGERYRKLLVLQKPYGLCGGGCFWFWGFFPVDNEHLPDKYKPPGDGLALLTFVDLLKVVHRSLCKRHTKQYSEV